MKTESILAIAPRVMNPEQRRSYFERGFALVPGFLHDKWLDRMRTAYQAAMQRSRSLHASNQWFSLRAEHSADQPRVHRIEKLPDQDPEFWQFVQHSRIAELGADVLGPDVVYRDSMINVKCPGEGSRVRWHQDLPFYPHTNSSTIQVLIALYDVPEAQGPLTVIPGSHLGRIYDHYDAQDNWTGFVAEQDLAEVDVAAALSLPCQAGDALVLHPLTLHSSGANRSEHNRPYLIHGLSAADARSYTAMTWGNSHSRELVLGKPARYAHHEPMTIRLPPDWSQGYTSIFEHQQRTEQ